MEQLCGDIVSKMCDLFIKECRGVRCGANWLSEELKSVMIYDAGAELEQDGLKELVILGA
jgi:hypothetical protein